MSDEKKLLRNQIKVKLNHMHEDTYNTLCASIIEHLTAHDIWAHAGTIGTTMSRGREINTKPLIEKAWKQGKTVAVPKADALSKTMDFRYIQSFDQVETAYAGIQEPIPRMTRPAKKNDIDLLIVPGLLFDREGYRIGFGGGFYDRYLSSFANDTAALAFNIQLTDKVPMDKFDLPVAFIFTETGVLETGK